jgi:hypothetical protein
VASQLWLSVATCLLIQDNAAMHDRLAAVMETLTFGVISGSLMM